MSLSDELNLWNAVKVIRIASIVFRAVLIRRLYISLILHLHYGWSFTSMLICSAPFVLVQYPQPTCVLYCNYATHTIVAFQYYIFSLIQSGLSLIYMLPNTGKEVSLFWYLTNSCLEQIFIHNFPRGICTNTNAKISIEFRTLHADFSFHSYNNYTSNI